MSKKHLYNLTATAMMTALSIVFERIITITPAANTMDIRITLANIPIILAGIFVSPVMGAVCGVVSDLLGCVISGYTPFPILTLAPLVMGFLTGFVVKVYGERKLAESRVAARYTLLALSVAFSHIVSSFVITTYGLSVMRGVGFAPMFITRVPTMLVGVAIDVFAVCVLYVPLKKALKK